MWRRTRCAAGPGDRGADGRANRCGPAARRLLGRRGRWVGGVYPASAEDLVFDKLEADLARGLMLIPASKGFEIGSGFAGTRLTGSEHNDPFVPGDDGLPAPAPITRAACRGESATERTSWSEWPSSRQPPSASPSRPWIATAPPVLSRPEAATIPAFSRERFPWWRRWSASRLPTTGFANAPSTYWGGSESRTRPVRTRHSTRWMASSGRRSSSELSARSRYAASRDSSVSSTR